MKDLKLVTLLLIMVWGTLQAQTVDETDPMKTGTIQEQFDYVIKKSSSYEEFKVVKLRSLNQLKSHASDSILQLRSALRTAQSEIRAGVQKYDSLNAIVSNVRSQYQAAVNSKNALSFLGMELGKTVYNSIMWGLVLVLIAITTIVFLMFKRGHHVTRETKARLAEVEEEFDTHRKTALRREQKLARELMDERMKGKM